MIYTSIIKEDKKMKKDNHSPTYLFTINDLIAGETFETNDNEKFMKKLACAMEKYNWTIFGYQKKATIIMEGRKATIIRC